MKIFAYNLCIELAYHNPAQNFDFRSVSFTELMGLLFKGMNFSSEVVYLTYEDRPDFLQDVFDLQSNKVWRELDAHIVILFGSESRRDKFWEKFRERFREVECGGGLVQNEKQDYLFIYNREKWSLPKGHLEWQEAPDEGALREVQEETGLKEVELGAQMPGTWHTFKKRKQWHLKLTHWYHMKADSAEELVPQEDEKIEEVRWISRDEWLEGKLPTYPLIRDLMETVFISTVEDTVSSS